MAITEATVKQDASHVAAQLFRLVVNANGIGNGVAHPQHLAAVVERVLDGCPVSVRDNRFDFVLRRIRLFLVVLAPFKAIPSVCFLLVVTGDQFVVYTRRLQRFVARRLQRCRHQQCGNVRERLQEAHQRAKHLGVVAVDFIENDRALDDGRKTEEAPPMVLHQSQDEIGGRRRWPAGPRLARIPVSSSFPGLRRGWDGATCDLRHRSLPVGQLCWQASVGYPHQRRLVISLRSRSPWVSR